MSRGGTQLFLNDVKQRQQARHGNRQRIGRAEKNRTLPQQERIAEVVVHFAKVLAEFVGRLDAKRLVVKIAERAGVKRTAHGGLQHQGQILIGRQNADRRYRLPQNAPHPIGR